MMTQPIHCKHCSKEIIGQNNHARVYYRTGDMDSIEEVYLVHEKCVWPHVYGKEKPKPHFEHDNAGEITCGHCHKGIRGEAIIGYKYEDDFVEDWIVVHKNCARARAMALKGLTHECPKCKTTGWVNVKKVAEDGAEYDSQGRCPLCKAEGYLPKPAIPIITDWKMEP